MLLTTLELFAHMLESPADDKGRSHTTQGGGNGLDISRLDTPINELDLNFFFLILKFDKCVNRFLLFFYSFFLS